MKDGCRYCFQYKESVMNIKQSLRKFLFNKLEDSQIESAYKIYYAVRYPKEMQKKCSFGNLNEDKIFYVIRPRTDGTEGLMSLFVNVAKNLVYAQEHKYVPIIDFKNYHTQYDDNIDGNENSWEFFFTQPTEYSLDEVYKSKNVILSGLDIQWYKSELFENKFDNYTLESLHKFLFNQIDFNETVKKFVNDEIDNLKMDCSRTLGLYLRGTDYTKLKPSGHPIQPTVKQAVDVVDEFIKKYAVDKIFLVTEDGDIYKKVREKYKSKCIIVSYDSFIEGYNGKKFLSHDKCIESLSTSPYQRGMNYLIKLLILSNCAYFVGGDTMGSWATMIFAGNRYKEKYVFDLGFYGK